MWNTTINIDYLADILKTAMEHEDDRVVSVHGDYFDIAITELAKQFPACDLNRLLDIYSLSFCLYRLGKSG